MRKLRVGALVLLLALAARAGALSIELGAPNPTEGMPAVVSLAGAEADASYRLVVVYRPNSRTEEREEIGLLGPGGEVSWTPKHAGITRLSIEGTGGEEVVSRNVAVRFRSPPALGVIIFLVAGALLFGGASLSMRHALEEGPGEA